MTVFPLLSSNQFGPSIPFYVFNAQRAVTFGPIKHFSSISSGLSSPQYTLLWWFTAPFRWKWASSVDQALSIQFLKRFIRSATLMHISIRLCLSVSVSLWHVDILYGNLVRSFLSIRWRLVTDIPSSWLLRLRDFFGLYIYRSMDSIHICRRYCCDWRTSFLLSAVMYGSFNHEFLDRVWDKFLLWSFNITHINFCFRIY